MKIDSDLRIAVRSAALTQKRQNDDHGNTRRRLESEAVAALLKRKPALKATFEATKKSIALLQAKVASQEAVITGMGFDYGWSGTSDYRISYSENFAKMGGKFSDPRVRRWTFDEVMAQLAAAKNEREGRAILKKYGINWS